MTEGKETNDSEHQSRRRRLPRGRVTVFPNWCKGCNLCVDFCPVDVLEQGDDGRVIVAHPERCTGCRWCELHCPDFAIFVSDIEPREENDVTEEETA
ncbi:MAG: 4Fe-4S binding protein [Anaerolineae bacterium]|jgi:2-oxoglutarate ferredoxin oxidoreductase subunit delta